jgi:hypothetical protein
MKKTEGRKSCDTVPLRHKSTTVSMRPRDRFPQSQWDHGIGHKHSVKESVVSMTPRDIWNKNFNFIYVFSVVHCRSRITFHVRSHGLNETAESDMKILVKISLVSMRPRDRFPRSQWDWGISFRCLNETAEILWHRRNPYKNEYCFSFPLKGHHCKIQYICKHCIPIVTRKRQY